MRGLLVLSSTSMVFLWSNASWSQKYPNRPVRIIVGFETGGGPDTTARIIGPQLSLKHFAIFSFPLLCVLRVCV